MRPLRPRNVATPASGDPWALAGGDSTGLGLASNRSVKKRACVYLFAVAIKQRDAIYVRDLPPVVSFQLMHYRSGIRMVPLV